MARNKRFLELCKSICIELWAFILAMISVIAIILIIMVFIFIAVVVEIAAVMEEEL